MSNKNLLFCALLFTILYLTVCFIHIYVSAKRFPSKEKKQLFDERQLAAQGTAYKAAFWTMLLYYLLYATISGAMGIVWCDEYLGMFLGVIIGITVLAIICIFGDAYFRPDQSKTSVIIIMNVICICQGSIGFMNLSYGTVIENGVITGDALQLFILMMCIVLDIAFVIKHYLEQSENQE
ncbi:MAG: hypothetical protein HUJ61_00525 [Bacilli bacterium]|nr:hypothetical protein [Bacilli bacterium]